MGIVTKVEKFYYDIVSEGSWIAYVSFDGTNWSVECEISVEYCGYPRSFFDGDLYNGIYQAKAPTLEEALTSALDSGDQNIADTAYERGYRG